MQRIDRCHSLYPSSFTDYDFLRHQVDDPFDEPFSLSLPGDEDTAPDSSSSTVAAAQPARRRSSVGFAMASKKESIKALSDRRASTELLMLDSYSDSLNAPIYSQSEVDEMLARSRAGLQARVDRLEEELLQATRAATRQQQNQPNQQARVAPSEDGGSVSAGGGGEDDRLLRRLQGALDEAQMQLKMKRYEMETKERDFDMEKQVRRRMRCTCIYACMYCCCN
jgi:hypothetical protein